MTRKEEIVQAARNFESIEYTSPYSNFIQGVEWANKTMIDKVCQFIRDNIECSIDFDEYGNGIIDESVWHSKKYNTIEEFIDGLSKAMEE